MLNPCYVHGTTHVHGYVHACSCMFEHVKFWLPSNDAASAIRYVWKEPCASHSSRHFFSCMHWQHDRNYLRDDVPRDWWASLLSAGLKKIPFWLCNGTGWHKSFVASYPTYSRSSVLFFNFFASLLHLFLGSHTGFRSLDFHTLSPKGHRLRSRIRFFSITSDERNSYQRFYIILHCVSASLSL